jgi:hypothetical protein
MGDSLKALEIGYRASQDGLPRADLPCVSRWSSYMAYMLLRPLRYSTTVLRLGRAWRDKDLLAMAGFVYLKQKRRPRLEWAFVR